MKILIIGAMKEEITFLIEKLENLNIKEINKFTFYKGNLSNNDIILVESGIGKVMSGIIIATAVNNFENIDKIINIGVAGGYNDVSIGDIVIGKSCVYGDCDVTSFSKYRYGQIPRFPFLFEPDQMLLNEATKLNAKLGVICTMDRFVDSKEYVSNLVNKYFYDLDIKCFDMESAAFAQTAHFYGIDFISIRAISDVIGSANPLDSYDNNLELACRNSNLFLLDLLKKI